MITFWYSNIAMMNGPLVDDLSTTDGGFPQLDYQKASPPLSLGVKSPCPPEPKGICLHSLF
jgi:hypothetical protein